MNFLERGAQYPEEKKLAWEKGEKHCNSCWVIGMLDCFCMDKDCPCHSEHKKEDYPNVMNIQAPPSGGTVNSSVRGDMPLEHNKESSGWEARFDAAMPPTSNIEALKKCEENIKQRAKSFIASELHSRDTALLALIDGMIEERHACEDKKNSICGEIHLGRREAFSDLKEAYRERVIKGV